MRKTLAVSAEQANEGQMALPHCNTEYWTQISHALALIYKDMKGSWD